MTKTPKLILMRGLPASGKSTKAAKIVNAGGGDVVRVNRDLLRTMLHYDKWTGKNEGTTIQCEKDMVFDLLTEGKTVIVDDTNLGKKHVDIWQEVADRAEVEVEIKEMDTSVRKCLQWNEGRDKEVPPHVITNMALQYGKFTHPKNGWIICDLDGTLCDIKHRLQYVKEEEKNWKAFFDNIPHDTVRVEVEDQLLEKSGRKDHSDIVFVTARPEEYREMTEHWLALNVPHINYPTLIMRRSGDRRDDVDVKSDIYNKYFYDKSVKVVFDDRPKVVRMWKEKGLNVMDVGPKDKDGNPIEF